MGDKRPIIVTGAHRSGTTWVGRMLAVNKSIRYIHEPFNISEKRISPLKYWFEYVSKNDSEARQRKIYQFIDEIIEFNIKGIYKDFKSIQGPRDVIRFGLDIRERINKRPLIKDPIAIMSIDWLAEKFNTDVVIVIRHPAAFVASIKVKVWSHFFDHFIKQPKLLKILKPYEKKIIQYTHNPPDIIDQGILLWNTIYYRIHQYMNAHPDWIYVRHEDLSMNPVEEFKELYEKLDLEFTTKEEKKLIESTSSSKAGHLKRDSKKNIFTWKKRLNRKEIDRIKAGTKELASVFYKDSEW